MKKPDCSECTYEFICDWSPNKDGKCKEFKNQQKEEETSNK